MYVVFFTSCAVITSDHQKSLRKKSASLRQKEFITHKTELDNSSVIAKDLTVKPGATHANFGMKGMKGMSGGHPPMVMYGTRSYQFIPDDNMNKDHTDILKIKAIAIKVFVLGSWLKQYFQCCTTTSTPVPSALG